MTEQIKLDGKSQDMLAATMQRLKELFPEAVSEGKIDFARLQLILGGEIAEAKERFEFTWAGKKEAANTARLQSTGTLRPLKELSKNWDTTHNLYYEGDNLEVLRLLQQDYYNTIKMIYIDPPYNTGKDFIYQDDFRANVKNSLNKSGNSLTANLEKSGGYHSNWLNMMYPRLRLAKNLLRDDGVIFVSLDDHEVYHLRILLNEIFGEDNFIAQIIHKNNSMKNQSKFMGVTTEYILVMAKNLEELNKTDVKWREKKKGAREINQVFKNLKEKGLSLSEIEEEIKELYSRPKYTHLSRWNKVDERGVFKDQDLSREGGPKNYTIINPHTHKPCVIPKRGWGKSYEELLRLQKEGLIWYGDESTPPGLKTYLTEDSESVPDNFVFADTASDKKLIDELFGARVFEFPKPLEVIKWLIKLCTSKDDGDIVLDFFAGSGTSAHAVLELNAEDSGNRKFIAVQLAEKTKEDSVAYQTGFTDISSLCIERIRRAGEKLDKETGKIALDSGFKVFKLDTFNNKE